MIREWWRAKVQVKKKSYGRKFFFSFFTGVDIEENATDRWAYGNDNKEKRSRKASVKSRQTQRSLEKLRRKMNNKRIVTAKGELLEIQAEGWLAAVIEGASGNAHKWQANTLYVNSSVTVVHVCKAAWLVSSPLFVRVTGRFTWIYLCAPAQSRWYRRRKQLPVAII